jgi:hypothetical protein
MNLNHKDSPAVSKERNGEPFQEGGIRFVATAVPNSVLAAVAPNNDPRKYQIPTRAPRLPDGRAPSVPIDP